jgi:tripartite motif-containing protein 71
MIKVSPILFIYKYDLFISMKFTIIRLHEMPMSSSRSKLSSSSSLSVLGGLIIATFVFVVLIITTTTIVTTAKAQTNEFNVYKFDNNGNFILGWGSTGPGPGQFYHAHGIAIDPSSGDVYVSDQGNFNSRVPHPDAVPHISKFTADGKFITKWGSEGTGDGQFTRLEDLAVDPSSGNVYVAELGNGRISKFTADGKFITKWSSTTTNNNNPATSAAAATTTTNNTLIQPWGVAVDSSGNILVDDKGRNMAFKFTSDGKYLQTLVQTGPADGQLQHPHGLAIDSSGNFYIADQVHANVQKFSPDGKLLQKFASGGKGKGPVLNIPHGVAVDSSGNIFVADSANHRVKKFAPDGTFIKSWGKFKSPHDVEIDASGNVYLINTTTD